MLFQLVGQALGQRRLRADHDQVGLLGDGRRRRRSRDAARFLRDARVAGNRDHLAALGAWQLAAAQERSHQSVLASARSDDGDFGHENSACGLRLALGG